MGAGRNQFNQAYVGGANIMNSPRLENRITGAIRKLIIEYSEATRFFMTESDVIMRIHLLLCEEGVDRHQIHSELRPYRIKNREVQVLTGQGWVKKGQNNGSKLDLSVIDISPNYWDMAYAMAPKTSSGQPRYWRFILCPCEAFEAAIEVKVRVGGNHTRIGRDIEELAWLHEENPDCLLYYIVLDKAASSRILDRVRERLSGHNYIRAFVYQDEGHGSHQNLL